MKLRAILVVVFSLGLWLTAVGQELTVQVPPGEYEFWLKWWEDETANVSNSTEGKHTKAAGAQLKVELGEVPASAKASSLLVLNLRSGLLAHGETGGGRTLSLSEADFHLIPELKVTVRAPAEEDHLLAQVMLEQRGVQRTALVWITGREGSGGFNEVDALVSTRVRVSAPGYPEYVLPLSLVDQDGKAITAIEVGLAKAAAPAPKPVELPARRTGWFVFFIIGVAVAGLASLVLGSISFLAGDGAPIAPSRQWLASIWGLPLLGLVGWWVCGVLAALSGRRGEEWSLLLPVLGWAYLLMSMTVAGRRFLSASALLAAAACASGGLAFLSPSHGGLFWLIFVFAALTLVSSLVGGLMVAFAGPVAAMPQARTVEAGICPYCGQRRHPVTGACACQPGRPREAGGTRLIVEAGERVGETFSIGERFTIGREPGNDLVVSDMTVSRRHCVIVGEGRGVIIRDEGSANGTLVNGERITERSLSAGDRIQVGNVVIRFEGAEGTGA